MDNLKKPHSDREEIFDAVKKYLKQTKALKPLSSESKIPSSGKVITEEDVISMVDASIDAWLTAGRFTHSFEKKLSNFTGIKKSLLVNSGSSANLIAVSSLTSKLLKEKTLNPGDEVITVAAGFATTISPILQNGLVPVFIDVDFKNLNIDIQKIKDAINSKTKAIFVAHTIGIPFDFFSVREICDEYGLFLLEDCCDALGSTVNNSHVGTLADFATLSFYPAHHITTGEGGCVLSNNTKLSTIAASFRDWGRSCWCPGGIDNSCGKRFDWNYPGLPSGYDHKFVFTEVGYNLKMTDIQAALGDSQINCLNKYIEIRRHNHNYLSDLIKNSSIKDKIFIHLPTVNNANPSWFGFPFSLNGDYSAVEMMKYLNSRGVMTRPVFSGNITYHPCMKDRNWRIHGELINTDKVMNKTLWVGIHQQLNNEHMNKIFNAICDFFKN